MLRNYRYISILVFQHYMIGILCKLWAEWPRDRGSTLVRDKRLFTSPTHPEWLWGQTSLQFNIPVMLSFGAKRPVR